MKRIPEDAQFEMDYCRERVKFSRFTPTDASEYERRVAERKFSGRLTKARYKALSHLCRLMSRPVDRCGHEWDCCGCLCSQYMSFSYRHNQVTITLVQNYNY